MSPRKTLFLSALAFLVLCAVTLAYYLPRLRPEAEAPSAPSPVAPAAEASPETHKPDVDRELVQSLPAQPTETTTPAPATAPEPSAAPAPPSTAPAPATATAPATAVATAPPAPAATPAGPDPELVRMLKDPPIQFEVASARLTPASRAFLDKLASQLQKQPQLKLAIEGHTDSQDRLGKNQQLSEARARAVLDYLAAKGVDPARLRSAGYGGSRPIADNDTAAGRARNRRIEFKLQG